MITNTYERGALMDFVTTPFNAAGSIVTPASVVLTIDYPTRAGARTSTQISMTPGVNGTWVAEWDTSIAGRGMVEWSIDTVNPVSADQGQFNIKVNRASP